VIVLRDGQKMAQGPIENYTKAQIGELMTGKQLSNERYRQAEVMDGRDVVLDALRGNQPHRYRIIPGTRNVIGELVWNGSVEQASLIAAWLGAQFAPARGQVFTLDFYENFHGVETVL